MATPNRAAIVTKTYKVLKRHYKPVQPNNDRPVLEQLLFAACLENAHWEPASQAFNGLATSFFDWNEVRVSTTRELGEAIRMLPDPPAAATHVKQILQSIFESSYSFELESLKKQNLGQAQQRLKKIDGVTPFILSYVTQTALGGHAIPLDRGALGALAVVGAATRDEAADGAVQGLERAIPKSKGFEFGSLLHQLGADFVASPYSTSLHKILLEIAPDAKDRLPSKRAAKAAANAEAAAAQAAADELARKKLHAKRPAPTAKKSLRGKPPEAKKRDAAKPAIKHKSAAPAGLAKRKPR